MTNPYNKFLEMLIISFLICFSFYFSYSLFIKEIKNINLTVILFSKLLIYVNKFND